MQGLKVRQRKVAPTLLTPNACALEQDDYGNQTLLSAVFQDSLLTHLASLIPPHTCYRSSSNDGLEPTPARAATEPAPSPPVPVPAPEQALEQSECRIFQVLHATEGGTPFCCEPICLHWLQPTCAFLCISSAETEVLGVRKGHGLWCEDRGSHLQNDFP